MTRLWLGLALLLPLAAGATAAPWAQDWLGHDPFAPDLFGRHAGPAERLAQRREVRRDRGIGDDHHRPSAREWREALARAGEQPGLDRDVVAARLEAHPDRRHRPIAWRIACTVASCGAFWLAMRRCASA